jgi:hypothetical protein
MQRNARSLVVVAFVAALSSAVTIGIWLSVGFAAAAGGSVSDVKVLSFTEKYGPVKTVAPDDVVSESVLCPGGGWEAVTGGYEMDGANGLSVASAVDNYPSKLGNPPGWLVTVVNPKAATGPVTFRAKVRCVKG